jgi:hypothetical protein
MCENNKCASPVGSARHGRRKLTVPAAARGFSFHVKMGCQVASFSECGVMIITTIGPAAG